MPEGNDKVRLVLDQQFNSFINLNDKWPFFLGLAEYVKTVESFMQTKQMVQALERQREIALKAHELLNSRAMQEMTAAAERMLKITANFSKMYLPAIEAAQRMAEQYQPILNAAADLQMRLNGQIHSSNTLSGFDHNLFDVARHIKAAGHPELVAEFEDPEKPGKNIYGDYVFSPTYPKVVEEEEKFERREQVEVWGAWHKMPLLKRMVFELDILTSEYEKEAEEDPNWKWSVINYKMVAGELERIRSGKVKESDIIVFFKDDEFRNDAQRVHRYLTAGLLQPKLLNTGLSFDDEGRTLAFMGMSIVVAKKSESDTHKLLRTLFKDTAKVWHNDEILDDWGYSFEEQENLPENKVYHAGLAVNRLIAQEAQIKDFLIVDTKKIAINKKYLQK